MSDLIWRSWNAYCFAIALLDPAVPLPDRPAPDTAELLVAWDRLCTSYRDHLFDKQLHLFLPHDSTETARWSVFIEDQCFRPILASPHLTRSLLLATGVLQAPTEQRTAGASSIGSFLAVLAVACRDAAARSPAVKAT